MLEFAESLTLRPFGISQDHVDKLRGSGWSDEDVVEIVHITGLFNYLVRVADGLGVELPLNRGREDMTDQLPFHDDIVLKPFGTGHVSIDHLSRTSSIRGSRSPMLLRGNFTCFILHRAYWLRSRTRPMTPLLQSAAPQVPANLRRQKLALRPERKLCT